MLPSNGSTSWEPGDASLLPTSASVPTAAAGGGGSSSSSILLRSSTSEVRYLFLARSSSSRPRVWSASSSSSSRSRDRTSRGSPRPERPGRGRLTTMSPLRREAGGDCTVSGALAVSVLVTLAVEVVMTGLVSAVLADLLSLFWLFGSTLFGISFLGEEASSLSGLNGKSGLICAADGPMRSWKVRSLFFCLREST